MKRSIALLVVLSVLLAGCGNPRYLGQGPEQKLYPTYGLVNESSSKSNKVCYEVSVGNIIWGIILIETVVMPAYFLGWSLYNPVRMKKSPEDSCGIDN